MINYKLGKKIVFYAFLLMVNSGCGIVSPLSYRETVNAPSKETEASTFYEDNQAGLVRLFHGAYRIAEEKLENGETENRPVPIFVGISLSGGGSRAAAFSASVMQELDNIGLLQQTSVISSVSGGSLTSAYYVLNPSDGTDEYWNKFIATMAQDLLTPWEYKVFSPWNIFGTALTTLDRSDLMADVMDEKVFNHAKFDKLQNPFSPGQHPYVMINTTLASAVKGPSILSSGEHGIFSETGYLEGQRWPITKRAMWGLGTDINTMRIADAVMASATFPGIFNDRTFGSFTEIREREKKVTQKPTSYIHVIDGGASDNLGVDSLATYAQTWHDNWYVPPGHENFHKIKETICLLILIDSSTGVESNKSNISDPRTNFTDYFIDSNFIQAVDAMMARRRFDTLRSLGIDFSDRDYAKLRSRFIENAELSYFVNRKIMIDGSPTTAVKCTIWHIALDGLLNIFNATPMKTWEMSKEQIEANKERTLRDKNYRKTVQKNVKTIETNFRLSAGFCKNEKIILQNIRSAAHELVAGDAYVASKICNAYNSAGLFNSKICDVKKYEPIVPEECSQ